MSLYGVLAGELDGHKERKMAYVAEPQTLHRTARFFSIMVTLYATKKNYRRSIYCGQDAGSHEAKTLQTVR